MNKIFILILTSLFSFYSFSQEETAPEEVENQSPGAAEVEIKSQEVESFNYIDLVKVYFKKNAHKDQEEILWSLIDPEYKGIKSNEFEYQKTKEAKYKEMKELILTSEDKLLPLNLEVELGSYDFKKEEFPIKDIFEVGLLMSLSSSIINNEISYPSSSMNLEKFEIGNTAYIKFQKLEKTKSVQIKKELAEKIVGQLGYKRRVFCNFYFNHLNLKNEKKKFMKYFHYTLKGTLDFVNAKCFLDSQKTIEIFNL